eukprot:2138317-Pyramimonas_sp.AAC.1
MRGPASDASSAPGEGQPPRLYRKPLLGIPIRGNLVIACLCLISASVSTTQHPLFTLVARAGGPRASSSDRLMYLELEP